MVERTHKFPTNLQIQRWEIWKDMQQNEYAYLQATTTVFRTAYHIAQKDWPYS